MFERTCLLKRKCTELSNYAAMVFLKLYSCDDIIAIIKL